MISFMAFFVMLEFAACCVRAIVCILLLENSISDSNQADSNSCETPRRFIPLKEGIIKDGLSDPQNGNLFLNKILHFYIFFFFLEDINLCTKFNYYLFIYFNLNIYIYF